MSMMRCDSCEKNLDTDFENITEIEHLGCLCDDCFADEKVALEAAIFGADSAGLDHTKTSQHLEEILKELKEKE